MNATSAYGTAKGYVQSAYVIVTNPARSQVDDCTIFYSLHLLIGFSLELYLKSWLLNNGIDAKKLRQKTYGHNISYLYREARKRGLNSEYNLSIQHIAEKHASFEYRYPKPDSVFKVFPIQDIFDYLSQLNNEVGRGIGVINKNAFDLEKEKWDVPKSFRDWNFNILD